MIQNENFLNLFKKHYLIRYTTIDRTKNHQEFVWAVSGWTASECFEIAKYEAVKMGKEWAIYDMRKL